MNDRVVMILAEGFEEAEAVIPADVLRRLQLDVTLAGLESRLVIGAHDMKIEADCTLAELVPESFGVAVLPGGMPGASHLMESGLVIDFVNAVYRNGGIAAAICAAPMVLAACGLIEGKRVTCYPGFEKYLASAIHTGALTEVDGRVITGKGPGAAFEFAVRIAEAVGKGKEALTTLSGMFVR